MDRSKHSNKDSFQDSTRSIPNTFGSSADVVLTEHGDDDHLVQDVAELEAAAHVRDRHVTHNDHADQIGA